jgi:hypothetical protein
LAALCLPWVSAAQTTQSKHSISGTQIDVVANDYAFMPLPRINPGPTTFTFANKGKVLHELALGRLKHGVTPDDVLKGVKAGGRPRDFLERSVGILMAGPGQSPEGRLLVDLKQGETYLLFCNFRDTPEAPMHVMLGMYTSFRP